MAQKTADPCRNCGAELAPGAAFCTLCGTSVVNRAASAAPSSVPLAGAAGTGGPVSSVPGIIPVGPSPAAPIVPPRQMGVDPRIAAATALVPGGAGRRLAAWLIDGVVPGIILGVAGGVGAALVKVTPSGSQSVVDLSWLLVLLGIGSVLSLGWAVFQWLWEAKTGKTVGNLLLGLRTTSMEGRPAGVLAIFLRNLIVYVSSVVPTVGPLLVVLSNAWDSNGKRQGWHDKVAHTLVFNVRAGRDPLETGGIAERANFVPAEMPAVSQISSPMPRPTQTSATAAGQAPAQAQFQTPGHQQWAQADQTVQPFQRNQPETPAPAPAATPAPARGSRRRKKGEQSDPFTPPPVQFHNQQNPAQHVPAQQFQGQPTGQGNPFAPPAAAAAPQHPVAQGPITSVPGTNQPTVPEAPHAFAQGFGQGPAPEMLAAAAVADDEAGETRVRPVGAPAQPLRLVFDDGRSEDVSALALIGRNPAGYDGEMISRLISVHDSSRSVSKTHLLIRTSAEGLWVTDRNSTNGSAITSPGGNKTALAGGSPVLAEVGARVHFGDRSFVVGRA